MQCPGEAEMNESINAEYIWPHYVRFDIDYIYHNQIFLFTEKWNLDFSTFQWVN